MATKAAAGDAGNISIARIQATHVTVPITGTAPLIVHNWSAKAKQQMLDAQQGRKTPKQTRDPEADYEASLYRTDNGYGFPTIGFKAAIVSAARFFGKDVTMTALRQFVFMTSHSSRRRCPANPSSPWSTPPGWASESASGGPRNAARTAHSKSTKTGR
jgi:hypothetical protein